MSQQDLGPIGDSPRHAVLVRRVGEVLDASRGTFRASLGKATQSVELKRALGSRMGVRADDIKLGFEGRDFEDATPLEDVCGGLIPRKLDRAINLVYELESGDQWLPLAERLAREQGEREEERERHRSEQRRQRAAEERQRADERLYKMCPQCHAGPLLNTACPDMAAHHGICPRCNQRPPSTVLRRRGVAGARIPECASCNVPVTFNGCTSCGHLFTGARWDDLPDWQGVGRSL